jgi:hypothetical protein
MKNRELATRMRAQPQELSVDAAVEMEMERRVMSLDRDFVWLGAV